MTDPKTVLLEDNAMEITEQTRATVQNEVANQDAMIILGYAIFGIVLLTAISFGGMASGTAPGNFASMTVFP